MKWIAIIISRISNSKNYPAPKEELNKSWEKILAHINNADNSEQNHSTDQQFKSTSDAGSQQSSVQ